METKYDIGDKVYFVRDLDLAIDTEIRWGTINNIEVDAEEIVYKISIEESGSFNPNSIDFEVSETWVLGKTTKEAIEYIKEITDRAKRNWIKELGE